MLVLILNIVTSFQKNITLTIDNKYINISKIFKNSED